MAHIQNLKRKPYHPLFGKNLETVLILFFERGSRSYFTGNDKINLRRCIKFGGRRRLAEGQLTNKKRLKFLRREEACRRQAYKPKETPEETREFLRREEACQRMAYKPKEKPEETRLIKHSPQKKFEQRTIFWAT